MSSPSSRFKDFGSIIIDDDPFGKRMKIQLSDIPENLNIRNLLNYLKCNGWMNYKFNETGISTVVILSYIPPVLKIK
jgi:hypothetical protein